MAVLPWGTPDRSPRFRDVRRVVALFAFVCPGSLAKETNPQASANHTTTTLLHDVKRTSLFVCLFALRKFLVRRDGGKSSANGEQHS
jgi:hypothetical protein